MPIPAAALQLGSLAIATIVAMFTRPGRDLVERFGMAFYQSQFPDITVWSTTDRNGLNVLHDVLLQSHDPEHGEELWLEMSQQIGARDAQHAQDWINRTIAFIQARDVWRAGAAVAGVATSPITLGIVGLGATAAYLLWRRA